MSIDTASFGSSADPQLSSSFFTLLPAEIRNLIYIECWNLGSARQHIVKEKKTTDEQCQDEQWGHIPCRITPDTEDYRYAEFVSHPPTSVRRAAWGRRLKSEWCLHWSCEERGYATWGQKMAMSEAARARAASSVDPWPIPQDPIPGMPPRKAGFLDALQTCKRMYLEALPSLYTHTTFIFTDTHTAGAFLSHYGPQPDRFPIRSVELCIRLTNLLTELYYPHASGSGNGGDEGPPAVFAGRARPMLSAQHNPWQQLCDALVALPHLQDLRVWLDSSDLRPWHKRVSEARFFARLCDVRVPDRHRFVLGLPELPERRGPDSHALAADYLEGEKLEKVPFTVERSPRPNNGGVHLGNLGNGPA